MALPANAQVQFDGFGRATGPLFSLTRPKNLNEIGPEWAAKIVEELACGRMGCPCNASKRRGRGKTHCPAHPDVHSPSLSVDPKENTTTWKCHTGCSQEAVLKALADRGLLPPREERPKYVPPRNDPPPQEEPPDEPDPDYRGPDDDGNPWRPGNVLVRLNDGRKVWKGTGLRHPPVETPENPDQEGLIDHAWDLWEDKTGLSREFTMAQGVYYDAEMSALIFPFEGLEAYKYRPWPPGKTKYLWPEGVKRPELWPLPDADLKAETIFITAGETDCLTLRYHGYTAFAITGGEGKPCPATALSDFVFFGTTKVVVCFDADQAGSDGSQKQAACSYLAGFETLVMFPPLVAARGRKDINDLHVLLHGNTEQFRKWFDIAVERAHKWSPRNPGPFLREQEEAPVVPQRRLISHYGE